MALLKPFKGVRPTEKYALEVASKPYDVLNTEEARQEADGLEYSFLRVIKPELEFSDDQDPYTDEVYQRGKDNYDKFRKDGVLKQDETDNLYIYQLIMNGKKQTGIVGCNAIDDYFNNTIKKHELTRPDKEEDRKQHVRKGKMNAEPVFFSYPAVNSIDQIVEDVKSSSEPVYDFTASDGVQHTLWVVEDRNKVEDLVKLFDKKVESIYVADGHHRTAAGALVGKEFREADPNTTGHEEYNFFMSVLFPDNQLNIIDYNRVVKDLNNHSEEEFIEKLKNSFELNEEGSEPYKPSKLHEMSMYLDGKWYSMKAKDHTYDDNDPIGVLDVTILSNEVLNPLLGIENLRTDKRIDFVGGIRGLGELERRVDNGEMKVAFALYPVSMQQLIDISDSGEIMPPKTTWFEPKLRSGLVIHELF